MSYRAVFQHLASGESWACISSLCRAVGLQWECVTRQVALWSRAVDSYIAQTTFLWMGSGFFSLKELTRYQPFWKTTLPTFVYNCPPVLLGRQCSELPQTGGRPACIFFLPGELPFSLLVGTAACKKEYETVRADECKREIESVS